MIQIYVGALTDLWSGEDAEKARKDGVTGVGVQLIEGEDNVILTRPVTKGEYDALVKAGAEEV